MGWCSSCLLAHSCAMLPSSCKKAILSTRASMGYGCVCRHQPLLSELQVSIQVQIQPVSVIT